jgi:hypothetical protein
MKHGALQDSYLGQNIIDHYTYDLNTTFFGGNLLTAGWSSSFISTPAICLIITSSHSLPNTDFLQKFRFPSGSERDNVCRQSSESSLELIKLSSMNKVSLGFLL